MADATKHELETQLEQARLDAMEWRNFADFIAESRPSPGEPMQKFAVGFGFGLLIGVLIPFAFFGWWPGG